MSDVQKELNRASQADRSAKSKALKKLKESAEYQALSIEEDKKQAEKVCIEMLMAKR